MRNFSSIAKTCFSSYDINCGEYTNSVPVGDVLKALAKAFESKYHEVDEAFTLIVRSMDADVYTRLTISETSVLLDLYEFVKLIAEPRSFTYKVPTAVFQYVNMSTGATVVWTHSVF